uniref:Uncharacterized protein n=1 Tax=Physcomitrium patens TaxID=3218 RepID=A0A2K1IB35_PHYPA|nr:hypothetical protein PHYPA_031054 [Physcomitrium patens]
MIFLQQYEEDLKILLIFILCIELG